MAGHFLTYLKCPQDLEDFLYPHHNLLTVSKGTIEILWSLAPHCHGALFDLISN
jgi:hypothetical protein